ncbi:MAG: ribonuclease domain-containing protein [Nocardioidaceae bacterium]
MLLAVVAVAALGLVTGNRHPSQHQPSSSGSTSSATHGGLPVIAATALPAAAQHTLALIARGGPFPYDRDGVVFENFEGLLPSESSGYYHEYTVPTPGESGRGARRLITGAGGEIYWTDDHYASFSWVQR